MSSDPPSTPWWSSRWCLAARLLLLTVLKPGYAGAHGNLGAALAATGDLAEALVELREAARLAPESAVAHSRLGIALAEADGFDEAVTRLQRAVELDPSDEGARTNLVRRLHAAAPVR